MSLTNCCGLKHQSDNAEEVDISVIHCELHKDSPSVSVNPDVVKKVLKQSVKGNIQAQNLFK